jgi:hypothetical protein
MVKRFKLKEMNMDQRLDHKRKVYRYLDRNLNQIIDEIVSIKDFGEALNKMYEMLIEMRRSARLVHASSMIEFNALYDVGGTRKKLNVYIIYDDEVLFANRELKLTYSSECGLHIDRNLSGVAL